jgi:hypothetical protein
VKRSIAVVLAVLAFPAAALVPRGISMLEVLRDAVGRVRANPSIVTTPTSGVRCIPFANGDSATGKVVTRISGVECDPPGPGPSTPCVLEIQAAATPVDPSSIPALPGLFDIPDPDALDVQARTSAIYPACQVAIANMAKAEAAGLFRCACWDGNNACTWQQPIEGGGTQAVPCPRGVTMAPGSWSGAGGVPKACTARAGVVRVWNPDANGDGPAVDETWPDECPAQ